MLDIVKRNPWLSVSISLNLILIIVIIGISLSLANMEPTEVIINPTSSYPEPCPSKDVVNEFEDNNYFVNMDVLRDRLFRGKVNKISLSIDKTQREAVRDRIPTSSSVGPTFDRVKDVAFGVSHRGKQIYFNLVFDSFGYYLWYLPFENSKTMILEIKRPPTGSITTSRFNPLKVNVIIDAVNGLIYFEGYGVVRIPMFNPALFKDVLGAKIYRRNVPQSGVVNNLRIC